MTNEDKLASGCLQRHWLTIAKFLVIFSLTLTSGACAPNPESENMVARDMPQSRSIHDTAVVTVSGGVQPGFWTNNVVISSEAFSNALAESLRKSGIFRSVVTSGPAAYSLEATLEDLALAQLGGTVILKVDWRLISFSDNQLLWHEKIQTSDTKTLGDALIGVHRKNLAVEAATRKNIEQALAQLAALNF